MARERGLELERYGMVRIEDMDIYAWRRAQLAIDLLQSEQGTRLYGMRGDGKVVECEFGKLRCSPAWRIPNPCCGLAIFD